MLEDLDEIRWAELRHAYGRAEDTPQTIRGLLSPEASVREASVDALFGTIYHQGTLYEATAPAVPFLVDVVLAREAALRVRVKILWLLDAIAGASTPDAAQFAVAGELPHLVRLIDHRDRALALSAAALAARFPDRADESRALVRRRFDRAGRDAERRLLAAVLVLLGDDRGELLSLVREAPNIDDHVEAEERERFGLPDRADDGGDFRVVEALLWRAIEDDMPPV